MPFFLERISPGNLKYFGERCLFGGLLQGRGSENVSDGNVMFIVMNPPSVRCALVVRRLRRLFSFFSAGLVILVLRLRF